MFTLKPCSATRPVGALALLLLLLPLTAASAPDGRALYERQCAVCHESRGAGGIGLPIGRETLAQVSDRYLFETIRRGRPGRIMPAFQSLSDAQVEALIAYMRNWYPADSYPAYDPTPVQGDPARGAAVYADKCAECHGSDGSGEGDGTGVTTSRERRFMVMPAAINNPGFLAAAPDALIRRTVVEGRKDGNMPGFEHKLSAQDIDDVVAHVRTLTPVRPAAPTPASSAASVMLSSPNDFETTLEAVRMALAGANFRMFPERFLEEGLIDEFSHNTRQVTIRFCNFKQLYGMLNIEPRLGVVLPCRITVLERPDGEVLLIAPNFALIATWFNNDELAALGDRMHGAVLNVLEEATF